MEVYFEAAAVIVTLVLLGQVLELQARSQTGAAIKALLGLAPKTARRVRDDGSDEDVPLEQVQAGRPAARAARREGAGGRRRARRHERGRRVDGHGRADPGGKEAGRPVIGATVNGTGALVMRAEKVGAETLLARIVQMVAEAQRSRAPIQKLADGSRAGSSPWWWSWPSSRPSSGALAGPEPRLAHALVNAVAVLIIACPCALGLATPMSIMVAMGRGATAGVLFKNAEAIEVMRKVDTLVVDKTGTLTEGKPKLVTVEPASGFDETGPAPAGGEPRAGERASAGGGHRERGAGEGQSARPRRSPSSR